MVIFSAAVAGAVVVFRIVAAIVAVASQSQADSDVDHRAQDDQAQQGP